MKRICMMLVLATVPVWAAAQNFAGRYTFQDNMGTTTMVIQQDAGGKVSGTLTLDNGGLVTLQGELKGTEAIGISTLNGKSSLFKLHFQGDQLIFTMISVTADNKPDLEHAQSFPFTRQGGATAATASGGASGASSGHGFAGTYESPPGVTHMAFTLQEDAQGHVTGTLTTDNGHQLTLDCAIVGNSTTAMGVLKAQNGKVTMVKMEPSATGMKMAIAPMGGDLKDAQLLEYPRVGGAAAASGNPLAGGGGSTASDPFAGEFSNGNMFLELDGSGGRYQGEIEFQGKSFPIAAQSPDGRTLSGQFTSGGQTFPFTGQLQGATLVFTTGGTTYQLRRQGQEAQSQNPLAGGGAAGAAAGAMNPTAGAGSNPAVAGAADGIQRNPMAPATPGRLSDNNPQSQQWLNHLRGKLLSRLSSYTSGTAGGYSSNERMLLYPNGQFEYYSASSVSVQSEGPVYSATGSSGGQGTRRGTWRIVTAQGTSYLALVYEGAMKEEYAELDYRNNKTYIDGSRVFVTNPQ